MLLFPGLSTTSVRAADDAQLVAAYVVNFARFSHWPETAFEDSGMPMVFCSLGINPIGMALKKLKPDNVSGRPTQVDYVRFPGTIEHCHVLFISSQEIDAPLMRRLLDVLADSPILTVSDVDEFAKQRGMIGIFRAGHKLKFDINQTVMHQAGLNVSTKLLKLAANVYKNEDKEE